MNKRNTVRSVKQICWPLSVSQSRFLSFPLSPKDDLPPNRCSESHRLFYFLPFQRLWMKCSPRPHTCLCLCHLFSGREMENVEKAERWTSGSAGWRYGIGPVLQELLSCSSAPSSLNLSWLGFVWQPALIAPWGSLGGREPSPWWSEHRTSAKQSIVTGARWGERNKMSQQQVFFFLLFLPLMPVGVCLAFDSSVLPSAKRVVCDIC